MYYIYLFKTLNDMYMYKEKRSAIIRRTEQMQRVRRVGEKLIEAAHDHVANCMINRELSAEEAVGMEVKVLLDRHHLAPGIIDSVGKEEGEKGDVFYMVTVAPSRESKKISRKEFVTEEDVSTESLIYI
jgi:hypothetical protein